MCVLWCCLGSVFNDAGVLLVDLDRCSMLGVS